MPNPHSSSPLSPLRRRQALALAALAGFAVVQGGIVLALLGAGPEEAQWTASVVVGLFAVQLGGLLSLWGWVFRPGLRLLEREHDRLSVAHAQRERDVALQQFQRRVTRALELIEQESDVLRVLSRATTALGADAPVEILLADSSEAHMRVGATHPELGGPGCPVESPWQCPALKRGRTTLFEDSEALDACPYLEHRPEPCAAACVPLTFLGDSMGVAHAVFDRGAGSPRGSWSAWSTWRAPRQRGCRPCVRSPRCSSRPPPIRSPGCSTAARWRSRSGGSCSSAARSRSRSRISTTSSGSTTPSATTRATARSGPSRRQCRTRSGPPTWSPASAGRSSWSSSWMRNPDQLPDE